jgi:hypothetical protein
VRDTWTAGGPAWFWMQSLADAWDRRTPPTVLSYGTRVRNGQGERGALPRRRRARAYPFFQKTSCLGFSFCKHTPLFIIFHVRTLGTREGLESCAPLAFSSLTVGSGACGLVTVDGSVSGLAQSTL